MHLRRTAIGVAALTGVAAALSGGSTALAAGSSGGSSARLGVYASGLDGPFGLAKLGRKSFVVAEAQSGKVTVVGKRGGKVTIVRNAAGVSGVAVKGSKVFSVLGGPNPDGPPAPAGAYAPSSVLRTNLKTGRTVPIANLQTYELNHNPDGQVQFGPGHKPYDALSNPFAMTAHGRNLFVADGGANDVLRINARTGRVTTFFVPQTVKGNEAKACASPSAQGNPGTKGCDPVPTGITFAKGSAWVSTLGAEAPGAGRIYQLNPRNGHVRHVWKGLTAPIGVAIGGDRSIYYGQLDKGGSIVRLHRGKVTRAAVTTPIGLVIRHGSLFATAGGLVGPGAGQIVRVPRYQFR